jgi:hypothetical protein
MKRYEISRCAPLALRVVMGLAMAMGIAACAPDGPTQSGSSSSAAPLQSAGDGGSITPSAPAQAVADNDAAGPVAPADAQWTIFCLTFQGPMHVNDAERAKVEAIRATQSADWYVIHDDKGSTLYYGFFKSWNNRAEAKEFKHAQDARALVANFTDDQAQHPYSECMFVPLSTPDPDGNPAWDLVNAKGFWSLEIAAFQGFADRKKAAVDAVREARAQGIEAYYYHGPSISSVCIGAWPREAVKEQDMATAVVDEDDVPLVMNQTLPQQYRTDNLKTSDGRTIKPMAPKVEVQDPTLSAAMQNYPYHAVNGVTGRQVSDGHGGTKLVQNPSFLVEIDEVRQAAQEQDPMRSPGGDAPAVAGGDGGAGTPVATPDQPAGDPAALPQPAPASDQGGQLKSLGN